MLAGRGALTLPARPRLRSLLILLTTAVVVYLLDHLLKWLVVQHIPFGGQVPADDALVNLHHIHNTGGAFGLGSGHAWVQAVLLLAAVVVCGYIVIAGYRIGRAWWLQVVLGAILGGAAANAVDRYAQGYVVDYIDVHHWPVFNLADICIVVGIITAVLTLGSPRGAPEPAAVEPGR